MHKFIKIRQRKILTRRNTLRLRYIVSSLGLLVIGFSVFLTQSPAVSSVFSMRQAGITFGDDMLAALEPSAGLDGEEGRSSGIIQAHVSGIMRNAADLVKKADEPTRRKVLISAGDTLAGVLQNAGLSGKDAYYAVKALSEYFDPRHVKSGQEIALDFTSSGDEADPEFMKMAFKLSPIKEVVVAKAEDGEFEANVHEKALVKQTHAGLAEIETSLYGSAARADIPSPVIAEMIRIYSWDVDFQRDIRRGDKVQVMYEVYETEDGDFAKYGDILYANLSIGGSEVPVYRFEMADGRVDYFQPDGNSIRKTLMKTPVDGARISSGYGMRHHPVLGYSKMHKGMDFAAPTGTPIYAAGDGVVEYAARFGSYGNYVRIRHNGTLKTAYAHMHKFGKGISKGVRVQQGDVIGYIGTTGRSTGPHLHYEVQVNNQQVNPNSVDLPTGEALAGADLKKFKSMLDGMNKQYVALTEGLKFAFNRTEQSATHIR